ncbi:hypothetical protein JHK87_049096 [Glycine soja]|nr:hypothetical protein JHK87_049096 [Glycine soja]
MLDSYLQIQPCSDNALEVSKCSIQWYCVSSDGAKKELISAGTIGNKHGKITSQE